jgi:two-component system, sporulation sensor kinase D
MTEIQFLEILQNHKEIIIHRWFDRLSQYYPGFYDHEFIMRETYNLFQFMLDIEIPVESHTHFASIPTLSEQCFQQKIPVDHIILFNQLWTDTLLFFVEQDERGKIIPITLIRIILQRVFEFERCFVIHYSKFTNELFEKQEKTLAELHEARLTVVGKMAASMAHEIRNPLTTILGFLRLIRRDNITSTTISYLDIIEKEFQNIQMQITGFLSFSKKGAFEESFEIISINSLVHSVIDMVTPRLIDHNIIFQLNIEEDILLNLQKTSIQQVVSNIINNSIDALSEIEENRTLIVKSQRLRDMYVVSIANNGPQIPEAIQYKLFEPFVTSKKHGTGLGLSICKQIMTRNLGDIKFASNPKETTFEIIFRVPG